MPGEAEHNLVAALDQRWNDYRAQFKACRREFTEEAVHDLRVAARRFLAMLDIIRALDPQPRIQKIRRFLKNQLDDLDDLRDAQVMLVEISETLERLPQLNLFQVHLQKREKRLLRAARKQIRNSRPSEPRKRIERIRAALEKQTPQEGFSTRPLQAVDNAYLRAMQAYG